MNRILITGGAGFIGSHVAHNLLRAGYEVRILDTLATGNATNLKGLDVELIQGSILNQTKLDQATKGVQGVVHLAACVSVPESIKSPKRCMQLNVKGTSLVLDSCKRNGVYRFVHASSSAVYGNLPAMPKTEDSPVQFLSPYAESKYLAESLAEESHSSNLRCSSLRFFNVYGPRQDPASAYSGVISIFLSRVLNRMPISIHGDGGQTRDFIHAFDVATYIRGCFEREPDQHEVLNVGTGQSISLLKMADLIQHASGHEVPLLFLTPRPGDVYHSSASVARLKSLDGHRTMSFSQGINDTIKWIKQNEMKSQKKTSVFVPAQSILWSESQVRFS
jgi:UDP-glucose 4-epimerase